MSDNFQEGERGKSDPQQATSSSWVGWPDLFLLPFEIAGLMVRAVAGVFAALFEAS
jgi:hypothetical protein